MVYFIYRIVTESVNSNMSSSAFIFLIVIVSLPSLIAGLIMLLSKTKHGIGEKFSGKYMIMWGLLLVGMFILEAIGLGIGGCDSFCKIMMFHPGLILIPYYAINFFVFVHFPKKIAKNVLILLSVVAVILIYFYVIEIRMNI